MLTELYPPLHPEFTAAASAQLNKLTRSWTHQRWPEHSTITSCLCFTKRGSFGCVYLHTLESICLRLTLSSPEIILGNILMPDPGLFSQTNHLTSDLPLCAVRCVCVQSCLAVELDGQMVKAVHVQWWMRFYRTKSLIFTLDPTL